jgi:endonuclease-3
MKDNFPPLDRETLLSLYDQMAVSYPASRCLLYYRDEVEFFVAAMLSAQSSDLAVNRVTRRLFSEYESHQLSSLAWYELLEYLYPLGLYKIKSRALALSLEIIEKRYGSVPREHADLISLPRVGEKIARVVEAKLFASNRFPVDRHITRIFSRIYNRKIKYTERLSEEIEAKIGEKDLFLFSNRLIEHGRSTCRSNSPICKNCTILTCRSRKL